MAECLRPGGWLLDGDADWGTAGPVDPAHPLYDDYLAVWRDGDWWVPRGYDKAFGQKLPALFERCGLQDIRNATRLSGSRGSCYTPVGAGEADLPPPHDGCRAIHGCRQSQIEHHVVAWL